MLARSWFRVMFMIGCFYHLRREKSIFLFEVQALAQQRQQLSRSQGEAWLSTLQQVLVQEQAGRVTNALGWCMHTPPAWWPQVSASRFCPPPRPASVSTTSSAAHSADRR